MDKQTYLNKDSLPGMRARNHDSSIIQIEPFLDLSAVFELWSGGRRRRHHRHQVWRRFVDAENVPWSKSSSAQIPWDATYPRMDSRWILDGFSQNLSLWHETNTFHTESRLTLPRLGPLVLLVVCLARVIRRSVDLWIKGSVKSRALLLRCRTCIPSPSGASLGLFYPEIPPPQ